MVAHSDNSLRRPLRLLLTCAVLWSLLGSLTPATAQAATLYGVQAFLDGQPGMLKSYRAGDRSTAELLEYYGLLNGLHPRLMLALLEATNGLISTPQPSQAQLTQPLSTGGPSGFAAQIAWANREIVSGIRPYDQAPTVTFSDGTQRTLSLEQSREGVAIQRFLSIGRTQAEWLTVVRNFTTAFERYFNNELPRMAAAPLAYGRSTLQLSAPWPRGTRVTHLAYFDHEYPLVDSGGDGNSRMVDYLGRANVQYNSHDGHDFTFPDGVASTSILAAAAGVAYARIDPVGRGLGVVILHPDGFETVYWHLGAFDAIFDGRINTNDGVTVAAGTRIGTSGASGISAGGTPHLHFEVRRRDSSGLRQIDPFGWYGSSPDPCAAHPRCQTLGWLWSAGVTGIAPFIPPIDGVAPIATFQLAPPANLALQIGFDGHPLQTVGRGLPTIGGDLTFGSGKFAQALRLSGGELSYPLDPAVSAQAGTLALWLQVPASYPTAADAVVAASSRQPWDAPYGDTLLLQRDSSAGRPQWAFVTVGPNGESHRLAVNDTLSPGWHLLAISWRRSDGLKQLVIDGNLAASATDVMLPAQLGDALWLGRRGSGGAASGFWIDELALYRQALGVARIGSLLSAPALLSQTATVTQTDLLIDANGYDIGGTLSGVQIGVNGSFTSRQPFAESYRVSVPAREGNHTVTIRFFDNSDNMTEITRGFMFDEPPRGYFGYRSSAANQSRVTVTAYDLHLPLQMQISQHADFRDTTWQPFLSTFPLSGALPPQLYLRLRDANGNVSGVMLVFATPQRILLPVP